ncbi:MAG: sulfatase-like hydrolase/transferase [Kiritimatiellia bacterium]
MKGLISLLALVPALVAGHPANAALTVENARAADRPNILWLVGEDMTTTLACYGDATAPTPALDRMAREGVVYERCFTQPVCAPSRATLITGVHAASFGPAEHMRASGRLPEGLQGFPALLRAAGYFTTNNAKTDYNSPVDIKQAWNECGKTAHWRNRAPGQPFFSVFNYEVTHESCLFPENEPPAVDPAAVRFPPYLPDTPEIRADYARHYSRIAKLDGMLAAELRKLADAGLAENTIVFFYGDNGGVLPRSKRFLQRSGTNVPLIVVYPPKWRHLAPATPGSRVTDPVHFVDFAPTVLSLARVKIPEYMQGRAFAGAARAAPNEFVFCTRDRMDERYDMMRSAMDSRWLYIRNHRPDLPYVQPLEYQFRARGYQSWARVAREGKLTPATAMFWGEKPAEELYDCAADPDNVRNLAADPAHRATLDRMRAALRRHELDIRDNGFLPEGSPLEGFDASRAHGAVPWERVVDLANAAPDRDPAALPRFIEALSDPSEPVRWWAAQACTMLGARALPAAAALRSRLDDPSGAVQVAVAEALAAIGSTAEALPVLERWMARADNPAFAVQSANVLDRLGESARPLLPKLKTVLAGAARRPGKTEQYPVRILSRTIDVLEGREQALVYPSDPPQGVASDALGRES